jgi:hypothetical protein
MLEEFVASDCATLNEIDLKMFNVRFFKIIFFYSELVLKR